MVSGYVIELFSGSSTVDEAAVLELWAREGAMGEDEARDRLEELLFIATRDGELAAVSTTHLQWSPRLRLHMWNFRTFVAEGHRESGVGTMVANRAHEYAAARFESGEETRGAGGLLEVENEMLKRFLNQAAWPPYGYTFVDENEKGDHVRIQFFPGVEAPAPDAVEPDPPLPKIYGEPRA